MTGPLLVLSGVGLAVVAGWQLFATFRSGTFRARGGRHIRRARHPAMFWTNVAGLAMAAVVGVVWSFGRGNHAQRVTVEQHQDGAGGSMIEIRKIITMRETIFSELGVAASRPTIRAVGMAVIRNPFAGKFVEDLRPLFEAGAMLGERLMPDLVKLLDGPAVSYGKGAIVGVSGEMEHGGACVHPMLGKPMRAAIGGGKAVIGSNVKVAAAGASLDVPLGHKDEPWSFPHFDTITVSVPDAPRPEEIVVLIAIADGGRLRNRCGTEPIR